MFVYVHLYMFIDLNMYTDAHTNSSNFLKYQKCFLQIKSK